VFRPTFPRSRQRSASKSRTGEEIASAVVGVKPELLRSYRWIDRTRAVVWRADEAQYVFAKAIHPTGVIDSEPHLSAQWRDGLKESLEVLAVVENERVSDAPMSRFAPGLVLSGVRVRRPAGPR
jgi:hypothetical protein